MPPHNRIPLIMAHTRRYAFRGLPNLARDAGISRSALYRLVQEETCPTLDQVLRLVRALSKALGKPLDTDEVFCIGGSYPTASVCALCDCKGCRPDLAYSSPSRLPIYFS
ncbi:helix-turn-helix domain-containing protein [Armatimonas rosea]|uniref:XRE family transcriptional regulator n=1 Tax=Armatimonas rosea TaxID=685828 RepID=A0A7W9W7L3_ARMRO|nr:helix-turn-helix domain-containing protein [Armatimonas rosea]MBB6050732.1 hypothetical protein [Armatimonas rosea]